jgi:hypothetical protein
MPLSYDPNGNLVGGTSGILNGVTVSGTPTTNQVLTATSSSTANWQTPQSSLPSYLAITWQGGFVNNVPQFYTYGPYGLNTVTGSDLSFNANLTDVNVHTTGRYKISATWILTAGNAFQVGNLYLDVVNNGVAFPTNLMRTSVNGSFVGQPLSFGAFYTFGLSAGDVVQFPFQGDAFNGAQFNNNDIRIDIQRVS